MADSKRKPYFGLLRPHEFQALLRALRYHKDLLSLATSDAHRFLEIGLSPGYLLDFDLVFTYIRAIDEVPEEVVELEYLLGQTSVDFVIGPGTIVEATSYLYRLLDTIAESVGGGRKSGVRRRPKNALSADEFQRLLRRVLKRADDVIQEFSVEILSLRRLQDLVDRPNVFHYAQLLADDLESITAAGTHSLSDDLKQIEVAREEAEAYAYVQLEGRRNKPEQNDRADAMNYGAIIELRNRSQIMGSSLPFAFLLTNTIPLLREEEWSGSDPVSTWSMTTTISREPSSAIYSHLLQTRYSDKEDAATRSGDLENEASQLATQIVTLLRSDEKFRDQEPARASFSPPNLQRVQKALKLESLHLLELVEDFFFDPVVQEAQQVHDSLDLFIANWAAQHGEIMELSDSPRHLLDSVKGAIRSLDDRGGKSKSIGEQWERSIEVRSSLRGGAAISSYVDRGAMSLRATEYLHVEEHKDRGFITLSWPAHADLLSILDRFSRAYSRHDQTELKLLVGTIDGEVYETAISELPLTSEELTGGLPNPAAWIRFVSSSFDLYADIIASVGEPPIVSVIGGVKLRRDHVAALYQDTAARFVFPVWLTAMLEKHAFPNEWTAK